MTGRDESPCSASRGHSAVFSSEAADSAAWGASSYSKTARLIIPRASISRISTSIF